MTIYQVSYTHEDERHTVKYELIKTDVYRREIILNDVRYTEAYNWCVKHIKDDDIYQENDGVTVYCNITGKELRKSNSRCQYQ